MNKHNIVPGIVFSALTVLLAAGAGGCALSVEADVPEIEVTKKDVMFEGVPLGMAFGPVSMSKTFSQKHSALELPEGLTTEIHAIGVTLKAKNGIKDFSFLQQLHLTMSDEKDPTKAVELIAYDQDPTKPATDTLTMISKNPANALDQWKTEEAMFSIQVMGTLPSENWSADIIMRFGGSVKYSR